MSPLKQQPASGRHAVCALSLRSSGQTSIPSGSHTRPSQPSRLPFCPPRLASLASDSCHITIVKVSVLLSCLVWSELLNNCCLVAVAARRAISRLIVASEPSLLRNVSATRTVSSSSSVVILQPVDHKKKKDHKSLTGIKCLSFLCCGCKLSARFLHSSTPAAAS